MTLLEQLNEANKKLEHYFLCQFDSDENMRLFDKYLLKVASLESQIKATHKNDNSH